jgi:hypothetical protein
MAKVTDKAFPSNVIQETADYSIFKRLPGNRVVHEGMVKSLMESFGEKPQLRVARPLLLNEKYQIIDGQHRKEASERMGVSVYYMVVPGLTIADTRLLNALQKSWTLTDFAESFASTGEADYIRFLELRKEFPLPPAMMLHYTTAEGEYSQARQKFRIGMYEPQDEDITMSYLNDLKSFQPYLAQWYEQAFAMAALHLFRHKDYDHERMLRKLDTVGQLTHRSGSADYIRDLETVYNKNVPMGNHVRFI